MRVSNLDDKQLSYEGLKHILSKLKSFLEIKNYSETEQVIGTWVDGRPLYRMVLDATLPDVALVDTTIANIGLGKETIHLYGMYLYNSGQYQPINASTEKGGTSSFIFYRRGDIQAIVSGSALGKQCQVIIEYVKTADLLSGPQVDMANVQYDYAKASDTAV